MFFLFLFNLKPTKLFNTQKEAISYGKEIAKNQNSELVIHNKHSKIHEVVYIQLLILRLLSDSTSRWTPLSFANSLPLSCSIRDFHPQVVAHAGHTKNKKKPNWLLFVLYTSITITALDRSEVLFSTSSLGIPMRLPMGHSWDKSQKSPP